MEETHAVHELLLLVVLTLNRVVGLAPVSTTAHIVLDPSVKRAEVCLVWQHPDVMASDCWMVEGPAIRTWWKGLTFDRPGTWRVFVTVDGVDTKEQALHTQTPTIVVEVQ